MQATAKKTTTILTRYNISLAVVLSALQIFQLFLLPLFLLPHNTLWGLAVLLLIPIGNSMWSLIHEAIHRLCYPSAGINDRMGRALSILFGVSFDVVKFGHLMHHRYNRDWESEFYDPRKTPRWQAALLYYGKILGGYYIVEILMSVLFLLPVSILKKLTSYQARTAFAHLGDIESISNNFFFVRNRAKSIRQDTIAILLIFSASALAYGPHWPWFALMLAGRAFSVSFMDNIYHYATPTDNSVPAKEITMPRWMEVLMLHGNHHHSHHRQSNVAWNGLPAVRNDIGIPCHQTFWQAARDQFKGPIAITAPAAL
jgi:fatty acid desaturase